MMRGSPVVLAIVLGCGSAPQAPAIRFANHPPIEAVNDRLDVPQPPKARHALYDYDTYRSSFYVPVMRALELPVHQRAEGVNALDEVPDSSWFTNRGELTPEQVANGPATVDNPELHLPWTIVSSKTGGISPGFVIEDARGIKYVLKIEDSAFPETQSGADVIVDRLVWAAGYNVPEDHVVYFLPTQLLVGPKSVEIDTTDSVAGPLHRDTVDKVLAKSPIHEGGRLRGTASRWLDGKTLGPPPPEGVRKDDRNDRIPHERRRDLRGLYVVYSWLDNVDAWGGNFVDTWVDDPQHPGQHYVKHYAVDFDDGLGVSSSKTFDLSRGHTYRVDWSLGARALFSGGAYHPSWQEPPPNAHIRGVAPTFSTQNFDPGYWRTLLPYLPFQTKDRFDGFWGAKLVARFTRPQIRAAVEAARFSDPRAVDFLTDVLVARQRKLASYWYARVNPLDGFATDGGALCFDDLAIMQGYVDPQAGTRYAIIASDFAGHSLGSFEVPAATSGHTCLSMPARATDHGGYTIFKVKTLRSGYAGSTYVHTAVDPTGTPQVIGIWRV